MVGPNTPMSVVHWEEGGKLHKCSLLTILLVASVGPSLLLTLFRNVLRMTPDSHLPGSSPTHDKYPLE